MTLPDERYRAVMFAQKFLGDLCDPKKTPRIPKRIRQQAYSILRHYPSGWHMEQVADNCPDVFQKQIEPVTRLFLQHENSKAVKNGTKL